MISWMQKHNKYLVWTIWVATIAFIGAGFVGWGSYDFGAKAGNVAKVGDIEIKQSKLNMAYSNLYSRYSQMFQGQFDEKKAKELGLLQQAFATVETQAKLLNYAKEMGIIVSDEEVAQTLESIKGFQKKDGQFDKNIYKSYLQSRRLKAKTFEDSLREELIIAKLLDLLNVPALPLEKESTSAAINVADKIKYRVLSPNDINVTLDDTKLKIFWEKNKEAFLTPKKYILAIVWTTADETPVSDDELKSFFETNSFNYTSPDGKQLTFDEAKDQVVRDLKLKKTKKTAQKAYIAFKKQKREASETLTLPLGDTQLTKAVWDEIIQRSAGDILKPKVVNGKYATIKITEIIEPKIMTFEEAKKAVTKSYIEEEKKNLLNALAESTLKEIEKSDAPVSNFISLNHFDNIQGLNQQESLQFLQKLFTSLKEKGMITVANKVVIYSIVEQTILPADENQTKTVEETVNTTKQRVFETNFIRILDTKYPTEVYMGGLTK
jgi:peptidyl-prolyl cis-trans isomerase D